MPRCSICKDLVLEVLSAPQPPSLNGDIKKSFDTSKTVEEFQRAAASGCVPCNVVLQAIALRDPSLQAELAQTGSISEGKIELSGNGNESLKILFNDSPNGRCFRFDLFEEWDHSENHAPLFSAVGLGNTPPEVLDIAYAAWRANRWISRCDDEHECGGGDVPLLPTRVLAITSDPIKLVAPPSGTTGRFAALSYCWGSTGNLITTSNNIKEREAGIKWETLPNLFQDVVQITRQMGIHFLWIDALCIIQDDQADWQRESSNMGGIYAGAYVTIACDSAADTSYRLTNPRNCALRREGGGAESAKRDDNLRALAPVVVDGHAHSFFARDILNHVDLVRDPPDYKLSYPLILRGWSMQERFLSSRILHFTAHEMIWECQKTSHCECGGISLDVVPKFFQSGTSKVSFERAKAILKSNRTISLPNLTCPGDTLRNESFVLFWTKLMTGYKTRRLTFESDRLPGISAIARNFGLAKTYIAGLWLEDLPWHLAWDVTLNSTRSRPSFYNGPTWSWVSVLGEASWPRDMHLCRSHVRVMEASTNPVGLDEFGQVAWGRVRLQARVTAAKALKTDNSYLRIDTSYGTYGFRPDATITRANTSLKEGKGQIPSDQRSASTVADNEDMWCFPVLGSGEVSGAPGLYWMMVVAKPKRESIQRALLDPNSQPESLICERIGRIEFRPGGIWEMGIRNWLSSSDFKEREVIII